MTPHINIASDIAPVVRLLDDAQKRQVPFAVAKALTALAFEVQVAERVHAKAVFRNPRPFTQRAALVIKATKASPLATVYLRDEAAAYLAPFEFGGVHVLPGPSLLNPKDVKLDAYGQMRRGTAKDLLAQPDVFAATMTFKKSGQTVTGIWRRPKAMGQGKRGAQRPAKTGLDLLIRLGDALPVKQSLGFVETARAVIAARAAAVFGQELVKAIVTAR